MDALLLAFWFAALDPPSAEEIMHKVAANQERALEARERWTYHQWTRVRLTRSDNKLAREEEREYVVAPGDEGTDKRLVKFTGRRLEDGKVIEWTERKDEEGLDAEMADDLSDDLMNDDKSRDGVHMGLFPLTSAEQQKYTFKLAGKDTYKDREVYKILFKPRDESTVWGGEVLVDSTEFQPVVVTSRLVRSIPLGVRWVLGTDIQNLAFKMTYQRLEDGVWFPATYGSEFYLRAVFFIKRKITIGMRNEDFRRTDVASTIQYQTK